MNDLLVDLHSHSFFSDGSMSPEELVKAAKENGVGVLALTDHNTVDGNELFGDECSKNNIKHIHAVEIDALDGSEHFHVLAYGFDSKDKEFIDFIRHVRFLLDETSVKLVELMQKDYPDISIHDFMEFSYDKRLGGWKGLHYIMSKGLTTSLEDSIKFYPQYNMTWDKSGYPSIAATIYRIKKAGGYSVLAHPGTLIDTSNINDFKTELRRVVSFGLDGIECYYPTHSDEVTRACLDICEEKNLLITAGSDCHGVFGKTQVGDMKITLDKIFLKDLLNR